jgi:DNA segregation ATPase FtsK/SpoIIIE, S-DNA-T family
MKRTFNIATNRIKAVTNFALETDISVDQAIQNALDDYLDIGYEKDFEEIYKKAIKLIQNYERTSASLLQRELQIGYARALRVLGLLEKDGYITKSSSSKLHEVIISNHNNGQEK